jgi:hypothetical protein
VAFRASLAHIRQLVSQHPELEAVMKHIAVQQETDLLVSEALRQLRLVSACNNTTTASARQARGAGDHPVGTTTAATAPTAAGIQAAAGGAKVNGGATGPHDAPACAAGNGDMRGVAGSDGNAAFIARQLVQ